MRWTVVSLLLTLVSTCAGGGVERAQNECGEVAMQGAVSHSQTAYRVAHRRDVALGCDSVVAQERVVESVSATPNGVRHRSSHEETYVGVTPDGEPHVIGERLKSQGHTVPGRLHERSRTTFVHEDNHAQICLFGECLDVGEVRLKTTVTSTPSRAHGGWTYPSSSIRCGPNGCIGKVPEPRRRN